MNLSDEAILEASGLADANGELDDLSPVQRALRALARASLMLPAQMDAFADELAMECRAACLALLKAAELGHDPRRDDALTDHYLEENR